MDNDYLIKKPPLQALFLFSLPMIIGNLFQQTYTMVDSAIVGRYVSEQALAAVGASYAQYLYLRSYWRRYRRIGDRKPVFWCKRIRKNEDRCIYGSVIFPGYQLSPWRGRSVPWKPDHDLVKYSSGLSGYGGSVSADLFFRTAIPFYV